MHKGECGEKRGRALEKSPGIGSKTRKDEKKVDFAGQKTSAIPRKSPEIGFKTGTIAKSGDFEAKKMGWGRGEKMGFSAGFAML